MCVLIRWNSHYGTSARIFKDIYSMDYPTHDLGSEKHKSDDYEHLILARFCAQFETRNFFKAQGNLHIGIYVETAALKSTHNESE